jgi:hypothetical protein
MFYWGGSSVPLQTVLTLADIFHNKVLNGHFEFSHGGQNFAVSATIEFRGSVITAKGKMG